jgi:carboxypeptidase PM20D1
MGGHASAPPVRTPVGVLARAMVKVEGATFEANICEPVEQMFDTLGRYSTFTYKLIFANLCCFKGLFTWLCKKKGGELNALVRTTNVFTQMQGSPASNVIPPTASVVANMRLMSPDTEASVLAKLKETVDDESIEITSSIGVDPSPFSNTKLEGYARVCNAIEAIWPQAIVSPYLMIAASDSRHFCKISDAVYRFSAMKLSSDDRKRIHGHDERIREDQFIEAVKFYQKLLKSS